MWRERQAGFVGSESEEIAKGMACDNLRPTLAAWRAAHPQATMWEIEEAVEAQLAGVRAELIEELAAKSKLRDLRSLPEAERPRCESCGGLLRAHGQQSRRLRGKGDQAVVLRRSYADCPTCGVGIFPPR